MQVVVERAVEPLERAIVARALAAGHDVRVRTAPADAVDLPRGCRAASGLCGDVVVTVVGRLRGASPDEWLAFEQLTADAAAAGLPLVVVACSEVAAVEGVLAEHGGPWTLQACTTLDDDLAHALRTGEAATMPPGTLVQPVAGAEVADRVVRLLRLGPLGRVPDLGGPEVLSMAEVTDAWRLPMVAAPSSGDWPGAWCSPERAVGSTTWAEWVGSHLATDPHTVEAGQKPAGTQPGGRRASLLEQG